MLWMARSNEEILLDKNVDKQTKAKIRKIEELKTYFSKYWGHDIGSIYDKTYFVEGEAITYLVISSPKNEVRPISECFLLVGCFPYLGFFDENHAKEFQKNQQQKDYVTYRRPVTAYSSLGNFNDPILSTFFNYNKKGLIELVFHELYHTLFFVKNQVDLNENLAIYFSQKMVIEYLKISEEDQEKERKKQDRYAVVRELMVKLVKELNQLYKSSQDDPKIVLNQFLKERFFPSIESKCKELAMNYCFPLEREWNNASLAAFMTYEKRGNDLEVLQQKLRLNLIDFQRYIERRYENYLKENPDIGFEDFLLSPLEG